MNIELGQPLSPSQRVDATEHLDKDQLCALLVQHAIDKQPPAPGIKWDGHVKFAYRVDSPEMEATVYVWKEDQGSTDE